MEDSTAWLQRKVSTSGTTSRLPRLVLAFAVVDLLWEIIKANLGEADRSTWPWRFTVLDTSTCATVVALLTGIIVTRAQLSQTMQPVLSWSAFVDGSHMVPGSQLTVVLRNAGGGRAIVRSVRYRLQTSQPDTAPADAPPGWTSWHATVDILRGLGLEETQDFFLLHLDAGAAVPMTSTEREGAELLALSPRALERLSVLNVRVEITDALGDVHERVLRCIPPRPAPSNRHSAA